jgi:hypothetical protein
MVTKVENEAEVVSSGGTTAAVVGTVLHMKDELRTGAAGRLQVTFRDNTTLALGEKASVVIDRYVFDPDAGVGEAALNATRGALRFATGRLAAIPGKKITVSTPVAALGVRGTEFWFGQIDGHAGALLLKPTIVVSNEAGAVTLSNAGQGTDILSSTTAPGPPTKWPADKVARALSSTDFLLDAEHKNRNQQRRGENQPGENQQYAMTSNPAPLALSLVPLAAFLISTNNPASP